MKMTLIVLAAILGIGLIGLCGVMSSKNGAINLEEQVSTAKSGIDVQLSNRLTKLTELASCVKKYDAHEADTLMKVIKERGNALSGKETKNLLAKFTSLSEQYPDLKSQANYKHLMDDISITENGLAQKKDAYNQFVRDYNYHCRKFPTSLFLDLTGYRAKKFEYYEANSEVKASDQKPLELF